MIMDEQDNAPLFQGMDEFERTYAPQQLPPDDPAQARVVADEGALDDTAGAGHAGLHEPPEPAPVAVIGTSPSSVAAPPNIAPDSGKGAPGDPGTRAGYPMDDRDREEDLRD
jgi:hypothetical protein